MKYQLTLLIILINLSTSCIIQKTEQRKVDDGYSAMTEVERKMLQSFEVDHVITNEDSIEFMTLDAKGMNQICHRNKYTLMIIWATWCPACHLYFGNNKLAELKNSLLNAGIDLVLVSQNINMRYASKILKSWNYKGMSYYLDPQKYGTDEVHKQDRFLNELDGKKHITEGGVPKNFLLNSKGQILYSKAGTKLQVQELIPFLK